MNSKVAFRSGEKYFYYNPVFCSWGLKNTENCVIIKAQRRWDDEKENNNYLNFLTSIFITSLVFLKGAIDSYNYDMDQANGIDIT